MTTKERQLSETLSEREKLERQIFSLLREVNIEASYGRPERINWLKAQIALLQSRLERIGQRERRQKQGGCRGTGN
jgi:hypothetical protein